MTLSLDGLAAVVDRYEVLFCDVWGVIHNGRTAFVGPCEALSKWRARRGPVILISNSPRPAPDVAEQLDILGVPREAWSTLVTSGDATRELLAIRAPGPAFCLGPERDTPLYHGLGLDFDSIETATFIACTGPRDDETETPEDYRELLTLGVARGLDMICANPDRIVQRGDRLIYCGGALADLYEALGGRVLMAGKPYSPIYDLCFAKARALTGQRLDARDVLAVGDGVATDIAGANGRGIDAIFIASGIHAAAAFDADGTVNHKALDALLAREAASARFVMAELAW